MPPTDRPTPVVATRIPPPESPPESPPDAPRELRWETAPDAAPELPPARRVQGIPRSRLMLAFLVAAASDVLSIGTEFIPPMQMGVDLATAGLLYMILGWHWVLLPGLIAEALPGVAIFPAWVLVVAAIGVLGKIPRK